MPQDLAIHRCPGYDNDLMPGNWTLNGEQGTGCVRVHGPLCADNGDVLKEAALAGVGVAMLPTFIAGPDSRSGRLVEVLRDLSPDYISVHAVFPSRRYVSAKVKIFVNYLSGCFGGSPAWEATDPTVRNPG